ncbi:MAG: hypothetical protein H0V40_05400 [Actinobacteria bacterium]|nr:hypothetical protein [Actinomycetota bacterium]
MLALSHTAWWAIGSTIAGVVVLLVVLLLLAIIAVARRIGRQAGEIVEALDGARANTDALFDVARTNLAVDQITRGLRTVREAAGR